MKETNWENKNSMIEHQKLEKYLTYPNSCFDHLVVRKEFVLKEKATVVLGGEKSLYVLQTKSMGSVIKWQASHENSILKLL